MKNPHLLTEDALREWTGYERQADIERWLIELGIKPVKGKAGRIITTLEAVNEALLRAGKPAANFDDFEFEGHGTQSSH